MDQHEREQQFAAILADHRQRFGKIAQAYGGAAAEDLVQEILLQVWRSLPTFSGRSQLSTWCYRVAINTALTWRRKHARQQSEVPSDQIDFNPARASSSEQHTQSLFQRFLLTLAEVDQTVLLMHMDRLSASQIAETLGTSPGAVKTRLSRIRSKLASWDDENG